MGTLINYAEFMPAAKMGKILIYRAFSPDLPEADGQIGEPDLG